MYRLLILSCILGYALTEYLKCDDLCVSVHGEKSKGFGDICNCRCWSVNSSSVLYTTQKQNDGVSCGDKKVCMNNKCSSAEHVDKCKHENRTLVDLVYNYFNHCEMDCEYSDSDVLSSKVSISEGEACWIIPPFLHGYCSNGKCKL